MLFKEPCWRWIVSHNFYLGTRAGYPLQSFFAEADKKRISVPIPGASNRRVFVFCYSVIIFTVKIHNKNEILFRQ